tara:strand:- start:1342 stop:2562 length:1221 start_codon:yes stop_codon:yes gene_type:complete
LSIYNQKHVIFLIESPLSDRDYKRFGIQDWINHGWRVNVFDVTLINAPEFWSHIDGEKISVNFGGLIVFKTIDEILSSINNLENKVVFIDYLDFRNNNLRIKKAARNNGVIINLKLGEIPRYQTKKNFFELFRVFQRPIYYTYKIISSIKERVIQIKAKKFHPDYFVVGGNKLISTINDKKTIIIKAHNYDYDYFLKGDHVKENKSSKYLVFLDEDAAYHSDYKRLEIQPFVRADNYYPIIDHGLDKIAKSLKLDIKIAAHPKSNYDSKLVKYKLPTIKNNTFNLIKDSDVVVGHSSTALQWAVVLKKPIIFLTTNEIENSPYAKHWKQLINNFASILEKKVINLNNISNLTNFENYLNVDHKKYELYIDSYIKTKGSQEKKLWNIIIEHLERDLNLNRKFSNNDR